MTFDFRDARRQGVADALAALGNDPAGLRDRLEAEQTALGGDDWSVADRTYLAVTEDWLWSEATPLLATVEADPVLTALGTAATVTADQAAAVAALPRGPGNPPADYLTSVRAALDDDPAAFAEVVHALHSLWLASGPADRSYPFDDVGVLLPLRLETLFDPPGSPENSDATRWKLSLRVVPDEASVCRDNPHISAGELSAVQAFWQAARLPAAFGAGWFDSDTAAVAWQLLCRQVAPPRAAWLVTQLLPQVDGDQLTVSLPPDLPTHPAANRIGGLPPRLQVWAVTRDGEALVVHPVGALPMDEAATIDQSALDLPLPGSADVRDSWWASWSTAKQAGLGGEWLLDEGLAPDSLEALGVTGLGDETPDAHLRAQSDSGELGLLPLGAPTNTVHGAPAADLATDADSWRTVARARIAQQLAPDVSPDPGSGTAFEQALTGSVGVLPTFPGADRADDTQDSQRMAQALWPALVGTWLTDVWTVGEDAFRLARWAFPFPDELNPTVGDLRAVLDKPAGADRPRRSQPLCPEGPLLPVRIGDQPYGVLPVTALSRWQPGSAQTVPPVPTAEQQEQERVELGLAQALVGLRAAWSVGARRGGSVAPDPPRGGTVTGATTERFMELLGRDALSARYALRWFAPFAAWARPYQLDSATQAAFEDAVRELYRPVTDLVRQEPADLFLTGGGAGVNRLPLVQPSRTLFRARRGLSPSRVDLQRLLAVIMENDQVLDLETIFDDWQQLDHRAEGFQLHALPDSLLVRLLVQTCQTNLGWQSPPAGGSLTLPVLLGHLQAVAEIVGELDQPAWFADAKDPETDQEIFTTAIPEQRRAQLERAFRATLDTAAHRIDPWITGFAWQRTQEHGASPRHAHRLGAYGWVDGPFLGAPGPTEAGRLHTPSYNQTLAAIVLRDKFLSSARSSSTNDRGANPWQMHITSGTARLAEEIADEVRTGFHLYEIVGRHVENVVGTHQGVQSLRTSPRYAMRAERLDPNEVCNGIAALPGLLAGDPDFPLSPDQQHDLQVLHDSLDTYGDLLLADGVMQLINRQPDRAAETMDAAAGLGRPPTFEFLHTAPSGYQMQSLVVAAVPYVPVDQIASDDSPLRWADPSLTAFLEGRLGQDWTWTARNADDATVLGTVDLATLGLSSVATLTVSADLLAELARRTLGLPQVFVTEGHNREWSAQDPVGDPLGRASVIDLRLTPADLAALDEETLQARVRTFLGVPADSAVAEVILPDPRLWRADDEHGTLLGMVGAATLGMTPAQLADPTTLARGVRQALGLPSVSIEPPRQHVLAQQLCAGLGSRPATGRDLVVDPAARATVDVAVYTELTQRYLALHAEADALVTALRTAADDPERAVLLRRALAWGVTPVGEPADREALFAALTGTAPAAGATVLSELSETVAAVLAGRLAAAPAPADLATPAQIAAPLPDHAQRKQDQNPDGVATLGRAITNLAAPEGKLAMLACWPRSALLDGTRLVVDEPETDLDESWLTVVAAVRPPLARLEALQLELQTPLDAWTNVPGDPWRTGDGHVVQQNLKIRAEQSVVAMEADDRFVVAYGSAAAWTGDLVAVGLVDAFGEAVPMPQRSTMAAFGFNAPAARAPQAILLAVPPRVRQRLDEDLMQQTVLETRELAQARTAHVEDLAELQALSPTSWLPASGPAAVRLEPRPLFT